MSNQMGPPGISHAELNSAISAVRSELRHEINDLRHDISNVQRWVEQEIQRMEEEMRQVGEMIVNAIHQQTLAVVGGVAASTSAGRGNNAAALMPRNLGDRRRRPAE